MGAEIQRFCALAPALDVESASPIVTAVSPAEANLDDAAEITLTGERLADTVAVSIGWFYCFNVTAASDTSVTCVGFEDTATTSAGPASDVSVNDVKGLFVKDEADRKLDVRAETKSGLFGKLDSAFQNGAATLLQNTHALLAIVFITLLRNLR